MRGRWCLLLGVDWGNGEAGVGGLVWVRHDGKGRVGTFVVVVCAEHRWSRDTKTT